MNLQKDLSVACVSFCACLPLDFWVPGGMFPLSLCLSPCVSVYFSLCSVWFLCPRPYLLPRRNRQKSGWRKKDSCPWVPAYGRRAYISHFANSRPAALGWNTHNTNTSHHLPPGPNLHTWPSPSFLPKPTPLASSSQPTSRNLWHASCTADHQILTEEEGRQHGCCQLVTSTNHQAMMLPTYKLTNDAVPSV